MTRTTCLVLAVAAVCGDLLAQSNSRGPGYNAALTNIYGVTDWGRRGPAYPGGEVGVSIANQLCNPGSMQVEWQSPGGSVGSTILSDHPKFGFLVAKELNGRFVQISDWSYCKHAFWALASASTCGGTCQDPNNSQKFGINCSDIYSADNNASRTYLGPPAEINPWLGTWPAVGNYFDIGHSGQAGYPLPADGVRSLSTAGFDNVRNRLTMKEADIVPGATMYYSVHVVIEGEPIENRGNNTMSRPFSMTPGSGINTSLGTSAWNTTTSTAPATLGSILTRWPGASLGVGSNGGTLTNADSDGRFQVAVKVTGPVNGLWHYEYCVLNWDNDRGGASFRLPLCPTARVLNQGFRDIDADGSNDWTMSWGGGEVRWLATTNNPHNWNTLYNFWFDSDAAPVAGVATIDQARPGPGALSLTVPTSVPGHQHAVWLGDGCGTPATNLFVNGPAVAGNLGFALQMTSAPSTAVALAWSQSSGSTMLEPGCNAYVDLANYVIAGIYLTDGSGLATVPIPLNGGVTAIDLTFQVAAQIPSPPVMNLFGLSNGITVRFAQTGCQ